MAADPQACRAPQRSRVRTTLLFVGALLFLFEEWLWLGLTRFFEWLGRFGVMRWLDARMSRLSPAWALVALCVPMALLFPFKVAGLWMIASGRLFSGCLLMLGAKVVSTAVIARIFMTCRPRLLEMPWFARLHAWTGEWRDRIHRWIGTQPAWRQARTFVRRTKATVRRWASGTSTDGIDRRGTLWRWRHRRRARRRLALVASAREASRKAR